MGDALSTYFEAKACFDSHASSMTAAHAIHNGFTVVEDCHHLYHGEKVAFGTLSQLVLQNSSTEEFEEVINFCIKVELPVTLAQMGIVENVEEKIKMAANAARLGAEYLKRA